MDHSVKFMYHVGASVTLAPCASETETTVNVVNFCVFLFFPRLLDLSSCTIEILRSSAFQLCKSDKCSQASHHFRTLMLLLCCQQTTYVDDGRMEYQRGYRWRNPQANLTCEIILLAGDICNSKKKYVCDSPSKSTFDSYVLENLHPHSCQADGQNDP
jgi:hypothetical protein